MPGVVWKPDGEGVMGNKQGTSVTLSITEINLKIFYQGADGGGGNVCILCMCMRMYKNTNDKTSAVNILLNENRFDLPFWPL